MKFEVGKFYKTREGEKALVVDTNLSGIYPILSIVQGGNKRRGHIHTKTGRIHVSDINSRLDLVSEWEEPRKKGEFRVGDRVAVYGQNETGATGVLNGNKGTIWSINSLVNIKWDHPPLDSFVNTFHPKQCRRLIKKGNK